MLKSSQWGWVSIVLPYPLLLHTLPLPQMPKSNSRANPYPRPKKKRKYPPKPRRWQLTFYKKPEFPFLPEKMRYFISGEEICPETKRVHWQSYIELLAGTTMKQVQRLVENPVVHVEQCKCDGPTNIKYCKKDGNIWREEGTPAHETQGTRHDLIGFREHYKEGGTTREAIENDGFIAQVAKYPRLADTLRYLYASERNFKTELHIFWGVSNSGKSYKARQEAKAFGTVYNKPAGKWWDMYDGQDSVILEDFRGTTSLQQFLVLADEHPLIVPIKGTYRQFTSKRIYVTSNVDPQTWFNFMQNGYDESMIAFKRRITRELHFTEEWTEENGGQFDDSDWNNIQPAEEIVENE